MQSKLFGMAEQTQLPLPDADIHYYPDFLTAALADQAFSDLRQKLTWQEARIKLYGKWMNIPRLQAWYGDAEARYRYSGLQLDPKPWEPHLLALKQRCEHHLNTRFNAVLANLYRHGQDSMGMHADNEPELGKQPLIASISLGAERNFRLKHNISGQSIKLPLGHGSLLVMSGDTQQYWQHGIGKTKRAVAERINLTFRYIQS